MKTICVTGSTSRVGKTTFAALLLSRLPGWAACKVTTCVEGPGQPCPRGRGEGCGVCGLLETPYEIEEETGGPETGSKDTGRLRVAGASRVLWVRARPEALAESLEAARARLSGAVGILFEGNHVLGVLDPDVAVMVLSVDGRMKKSARDVHDRVDLFASSPEDGEAAERVLKAVGL
jgi:hypothetical protein